MKIEIHALCTKENNGFELTSVFSNEKKALAHLKKLKVLSGQNPNGGYTDKKLIVTIKHI